MRLLIKSIRAARADQPYAYGDGRQQYRVEVMRTGAAGRLQPGHSHQATLDWDALLPELALLRATPRDADTTARVGLRLRAFLGAADWSKHEAAIEDGLQRGERIDITVVSDAAEMYLVPWELLTLAARGVPLAALEQVVIGHAWLESPTAGSAAVRPTRVVMAWSSAGGRVPAEPHIEALARVCARGGVAFDRGRDVVGEVTRASLAAALADDPDQRPTALHVLCHGIEDGGAYSLVWGDGQGRELASATALGALLAPFAARLPVVTVSACDSGNPGAPGQRVGSVVQAMHRAGVPWVIGARYPLAKRVSLAFAEAFYGHYLGAGASVEEAFAHARQGLDADSRDFAGLQLYARDEDRGVGSRDERAGPGRTGRVLALLALLGVLLAGLWWLWPGADTDATAVDARSPGDHDAALATIADARPPGDHAFDAGPTREPPRPDARRPPAAPAPIDAAGAAIDAAGARWTVIDIDRSRPPAVVLILQGPAMTGHFLHLTGTADGRSLSGIPRCIISSKVGTPRCMLSDPTHHPVVKGDRFEVTRP